MAKVSYLVTARNIRSKLWSFFAVEKLHEEVGSWSPQLWEGYVADMLRRCERGEHAKNAALHHERLFVDGRPGSGQYLMAIVDDGPAGSLWLAEGTPGGATWWFVYDIEIDEMARGRGLGRATMLDAEQWVRDRGRTRLTLNVFDPNHVARGGSQRLTRLLGDGDVQGRLSLV